jgi:phage terminase large subunit GpA-like protein
VFPIRGVPGDGLIWPKQASTTGNDQRYWPVKVDPAKEIVAGRLRRKEPGPGYMHYSFDFEQGYFDQLGAEQVRTRKLRTGQVKREWHLQPGKRNEAFDLEVYALAARLSVPDERVRPSGRLMTADERAALPPIAILDRSSPEAQAVPMSEMQQVRMRPGRRMRHPGIHGW